MNNTYIRVEVKGNLTPQELYRLRKLLQQTADDVVLTVTTDFGRDYNQGEENE